MAVAEAITHVLPGSGSQASAIQAEEDGARKQEGGAENSAMCRAMVYSLMGASLIVGTANLLGGRRNNQFAGGD
ncbi:MAG: hypothetical protein RLZZ303_1678 [Candidatus Hydrogenedentota bacterium]